MYCYKQSHVNQNFDVIVRWQTTRHSANLLSTVNPINSVIDTILFLIVRCSINGYLDWEVLEYLDVNCKHCKCCVPNRYYLPISLLAVSTLVSVSHTTLSGHRTSSQSPTICLPYSRQLLSHSPTTSTDLLLLVIHVNDAETVTRRRHWTTSGL